MKKKKIQKKLDLSKQTIANLGNEEMANVHGGCPTGEVCEVLSEVLGCDDPNAPFEKLPSKAHCNR
jgi:hypothetical protein